MRSTAAALLLALSLLPPASAATIDDDLRAAEQLAWQKDFAPAEARYRAVLARSPRSRAASLGLGQVLLWEQRYADAAAIYRGLLRDAPADVDARKGLATAEYWSGDFRAAQRDYAAVLRARPHDAEASRAVAEIASASAPLVASDDEAVSDDQPLRRARVGVAYTFFSDPLTTWTATAGSYLLHARAADGGSATAPFASLGGSTAFASARWRASGTLRLFRFPDGEAKALGGVSLAHDWRGMTLRFDVDRHELLYTASAIGSHPSETVTTFAWRRDRDRFASAAALHAIRYFDGNAGRAADTYHLVRVANGARRSLSVGGAVSYRDTDESRLRFIGAEQRYDPYWTPEQLLEGRGVAVAAVNAGRAAIALHADGGWARDRDLGARRTFHPWRVSADVSFPLTGVFRASAGIERQSTVFYRADSIRFGFSGRL